MLQESVCKASLSDVASLDVDRGLTRGFWCFAPLLASSFVTASDGPSATPIRDPSRSQQQWLTLPQVGAAAHQWKGPKT